MKCSICNRKFKALTNTHLKTHKVSPKEYEEKFGYKTVSDGWCSGEKNPFFGKTHEIGKSKVKTEEYKRVLSIKNGRPWNEKYGVETALRMRMELSKRISGENNPSYVGDTVKHYPYKFFGMRTDIINRDNNKCVICGSSYRMCVHHIDYNKKNCNSLNLVTLCSSCNIIVNKNRDYWNYFISIITGFRYGNQQPSQSNVENNVDWKAQRLIGEESTANKPDTSAGHPTGMMI